MRAINVRNPTINCCVQFVSLTYFHFWSGPGLGDQIRHSLAYKMDLKLSGCKPGKYVTPECAEFMSGHRMLSLLDVVSDVRVFSSNHVWPFGRIAGGVDFPNREGGPNRFPQYVWIPRGRGSVVSFISAGLLVLINFSTSFCQAGKVLVVSLFSGIGGLDLAISKLGLQKPRKEPSLCKVWFFLATFQIQASKKLKTHFLHVSLMILRQN